MSLIFDGLSILNFVGLAYLWYRQRPSAPAIAAAASANKIEVCTTCKNRVAKWQSTATGPVCLNCTPLK